MAYGTIVRFSMYRTILWYETLHDFSFHRLDFYHMICLDFVCRKVFATNNIHEFRKRTKFVKIFITKMYSQIQFRI